MMKVKELIKKLKCYNPDASVVAEYRDDDDEIEYDYLYGVDWKYDKFIPEGALSSSISIARSALEILT